MDIRVAEIYRLIKRKLILPALIKIDGDFFLAKPFDTDLNDQLEDEIKKYPALESFVNDPVDGDFMESVSLCAIQQRGLGVFQEVTEDKDMDGAVLGRKVKTLAPDLSSAQFYLSVVNSAKYGKNADSNTTNVKVWVSDLMQFEDAEAKLGVASNE